MMQLSPAEKMSERVKKAKQWFEIREIVSQRQIEELAPLFIAIHEENASHQPFDMEIIKKRAQQGLDDLGRQYINGWVAYKEGEPVGFFTGVILPNYFNDETTAYQQQWFVLKRFRGTPVLLLLLQEFIKWGSVRGVTRFEISTIIHRNLAKFTKMAKKLGFEPAGAYFIRDHYNA